MANESEPRPRLPRNSISPIPDGGVVRPTGWFGRPLRWARRNPIAASLLGLGSLGALSALVWLVVVITAAVQESILLDNLLRPIGVGDGLALSPEEEAALAGMAGLPDSRTRLRCLERGLADPDTARRLSWRSAWVTKALVGADEELKQQARELALQRWRDQNADPRTRAAATHFAWGLGERDPRVLQDCLLDILRQMGESEDPKILTTQAGWVVGAASWLDEEGAGTVTPHILRQMAATKHPEALSELGKAVADLAPQVPGESAKVVVPLLLRQLLQTNEPKAAITLGEAIAASAGRLEVAEASRAAAEAIAHLLGQIDRTQDYIALNKLARVVEELCGRLDGAEARAIVPAILKRMGETGQPFAASLLGQALAALGGQLEPGEAAATSARATSLLLRRMAQNLDSGTLSTLAQAVAVLTGHQAAGDASRDAAQAASILLRKMAQTKRPDHLTWMGSAVAALSSRQNPDEGARNAARASALLLEQMAQTENGVTLMHLREAVEKLAARLGGEGVGATARIALRKMAQTSEPRALAELGRVVAMLADRLEPGEASEVASQAATHLLRQMAQTKQRYIQQDQAEAVAALAARLDASGTGTVTPLILQQMADIKEPPTLAKLGEAVAVVAGRLDQAQVPRASSQATSLLLEQLGRAQESRALGEVAQALAKLAPALDGNEARAASTLLLRQMDQTSGRWDLAGCGQAVAALAARQQPGEGSEDAARAASLILLDMARPAEPYPLSLLGQAVAELADRLDPAEAATTTAKASDLLLRRMVEVSEHKIPGQMAADSDALARLGQAVAALAAREGRGAGPGNPAQASALILREMTRTKRAGLLPPLARAMLALTMRMEPLEATRMRLAAAKHILGRMASALSPEDLGNLAAVFVPLGEWTDRRDLLTLFAHQPIPLSARPYLLRRLELLAGKRFDRWEEGLDWLRSLPTGDGGQEPHHRP